MENLGLLKHPGSSNDFDPANDGIDHINIYSRSKTELGKILSNFAETPFTYEGIDYRSVEGALYYFRTGDERLINLYGREAKKLGKELVATRIETPELLKVWIKAKIEYNPKIIELLIDNNLPFSHYYRMYGKKLSRELTALKFGEKLLMNLEISNLIKWHRHFVFMLIYSIRLVNKLAYSFLRIVVYLTIFYSLL